MKIINLLIVALLVLTPIALADPVLKASVSKYEPIPAQPGAYVTVYIDLENIGEDTAPKAVLEIISSYPFKIDAPNNRNVIGVISPSRDYVKDFKIRVADDAIPGVNKLKIRFTADESQGIWTESELSIRIEGVGSDIQIMSITTNPEELIPGQSGTLRIRVRNDAGTSIRDIKLNLNLADTTTTTYPFIPLGTATQQRISKLDPGESSEFIYTIQPYPDAISKLYKIPITLTYSDVSDTAFTKTDLVGIVVNSKPELVVSVDDYRMDDTLILKVTNKGLSDVKFLTIYLEGEGYDLISQSGSYYVGELQSDDFDTTDFLVHFQEDQIQFPVKLTYRDANNNEYEQTIELTLKNHSLNGNGQGSSSGTIIIIVIVVVVAGFIVWRVAKKRRK